MLYPAELRDRVIARMTAKRVNRRYPYYKPDEHQGKSGSAGGAGAQGNFAFAGESFV
ncbi:hypothetical protein [Nitratireductor sp. XY-223]|uniref:hypothetical protein n=1 Tax=Nitratireductor sp. XY-223 TaxID=2561926 RepID=UPI00145A6506|nr:hypothetical protein [Nitratireductor sp. XY-223]